MLREYWAALMGPLGIDLRNDLRWCWRFLWRSPAFTVTAVLVLALGIGANTTMFSFADAALLAPLPFARPQDLVQLFTTESAPGTFPVSGPDFRDWEEQSKLLAGMSLYRYPYDLTLTGRGDPQLVRCARAESNIFRLLGVKAALGSAFQEGADPQTAVLSYAFWESEFGGDRGVIGRSLVLNGQPYLIAGVLPANFRWQPQFQIWLALDMSRQALGRRGFYSFSAIGRLRSSVSPTQAQAELNVIAARLALQYPTTNRGVGVKVLRLRDSFVGAPERTSLLILLAVVGFILLIACANIAMMLLARSLDRRKEVAIRLALGASRRQILRLLLTESAGLAVFGGAVGAIGAWLAVHASSASAALRLVTPQPIELNPAVLGTTLAMTIVCGIGFGLVPAYQLVRTRIHQELRQTGSGALGTERWLSGGLVVAEVALSMVLVVLAGLFLQSLGRELSQSLRFQPDDLLTLELSFAPIRGIEHLQVFQQEFLRRMEALPGIEAASFASELPMEGGQNNGYPVIGARSLPAHVLVEADRISPSYFHTMQIPLLAGRLYNQAQQLSWMQAAPHIWFTSSGVASSQDFHLSVVVNQAFAQTFFPDQDPIGKPFRDDQNSPWVSIRGVVANVPILGPRQIEPMPEAFFPVFSGPYLLLRSRLKASALIDDVRRVLARMDAPLAVYNVREMRQVIGDSSGADALQSLLIAAFATLALLLATTGVYGIMSYLARGRSYEICVRMTFGASRGEMLRMVLGQCLRMTGVGVAVGAIISFAAGRLVRSELFETPVSDPRLLIGAAAIMIFASLLACYVPARRVATSTDPLRVLRGS